MNPSEERLFLNVAGEPISTVRVQVLSDEAAKDEGAEAIRVLIAAGLMHRPERTAPPPDPVPEENRRALAERLSRAPGKSLPDVVIEDRGER